MCVTLRCTVYCAVCELPKRQLKFAVRDEYLLDLQQLWGRFDRKPFRLDGGHRVGSIHSLGGVGFRFD